MPNTLLHKDQLAAARVIADECDNAALSRQIRQCRTVEELAAVLELEPEALSEKLAQHVALSRDMKRS